MTSMAPDAKWPGMDAYLVNSPNIHSPAHPVLYHLPLLTFYIGSILSACQAGAGAKNNAREGKTWPLPLGACRELRRPDIYSHFSPGWQQI